MVSLKGEHIYLRALEPEDLEFVFEIENNTAFWELSDTLTPYSRFVIMEYLKNAKQDIFEAKQLRLAICNKSDNKTIGLIDLYDFNAIHRRAGLGIIIKDAVDRSKGVGREALKLLVNYSFKVLHLHQVYANISEDNNASLKLFENCGFERIGLKKNWTFNGQKFKNEYLLQRINA